ncbi:MAG: DUF4294 domain-containing protein [Nonlabens sp.]
MKLYIFLGVFGFFAFAKAQPPSSNLPVTKDSTFISEKEFFYVDGDSLSAIELEDVLLLQKLKFDSRYERIKYLILKRKVRKVWPYAKLAAERLVVLDQRLAKIKTKNRRKKYSRMVESYIEDEFKKELKKFSKTEGQILIKLIHRQTGQTAYDLLKRLRSGWSAFWFDQTASLFNISLKETYAPDKVIEDFYIEDILLNQFLNEKLPEQEAAVQVDYYKGRELWKEYEAQLPKDYDSIQLAERAERVRKYKEKKARKERRK